MENINIEEMRNSIIFMKKHPEYKKVVTNLLLYNDEEIFFFFNSKIKDENFITNLMKYIEGTAAYFNAKDDVKSRDKLLNLYSKCVDTIKKIDEPDTHTATNENQPYQISLDKKTETKVLLNYEFWNDIDEKQGNKNIFKNTSVHLKSLTIL